MSPTPDPYAAGGPPAGAVYAALDLGTNTCRLLVARPTGSLGFRVVDAFSRIVRLGERVAATGELTDDAMSRAVDALGVCAAKLRRRGVTHFRGVATEACRKARNGEDFLDRVERDTGINLEIIAPREEAELALASCAPLLDPRQPYAVLFDIGGGSTEVTWLSHAGDGRWDIIDSISLPCGVVAFAERFGGDAMPQADYLRMVAEVADRLIPFEQRHRIAPSIAAGQVQMLGTSGTVTTLSGLKLNLPRYDRRVVDGSWLDFTDIVRLSHALAGLDFAGRAAQPCIGAERADLVVAGCAILEAICRIWPVGRLRVADRGLREGIILGLMARSATTAGGWPRD
ncbi:MAG: Ppx/GppA family phosphatase [Alphaproteobacteria bacterium]|nr:Ppx/GppA family phosphatase [Alphaproteobacteria bacterium]